MEESARKGAGNLNRFIARLPLTVHISLSQTHTPELPLHARYSAVISVPPLGLNSYLMLTIAACYARDALLQRGAASLHGPHRAGANMSLELRRSMQCVPDALLRRHRRHLLHGTLLPQLCAAPAPLRRDAMSLLATADLLPCGGPYSAYCPRVPGQPHPYPCPTSLSGCSLSILLPGVGLPPPRIGPGALGVGWGKG
jgi:hypothetical protein